MIKMKTDTTMASVKKYIRIASVKLLSIVSTSFANRFVILPRGVVSKKDIGARRTLLMACCKRTLLALVPRIDRLTEKANIKSACTTLYHLVLEYRPRRERIYLPKCCINSDVCTLCVPELVRCPPRKPKTGGNVGALGEDKEEDNHGTIQYGS